MRTSKAELLCPAGDSERLEAALTYGADAVYLGSEKFTMRQAANFFDSEEKLTNAVKRVHATGKKLYLTANTLPHEDELSAFRPFLEGALRADIDAIILSDMGLLRLTQRIAPNLEIHMSTQTGIVNSETCRALYALGVKRAVLARELTLDEIASIRAHIPNDMELEIFVHGAMCVSFSGRCLLSQYLTDRDPNRGACAQPCRWRYALMEEKRPGQYFPIDQTENGTYLLNAKDLCMIEHLDAILDAGVTSLKIEGRQKSAYYVATITNAYRAALDACEEEAPIPVWAKREVYMVSHRKYCTGFYLGRENAVQRVETSSYVRYCDVVAVVESCDSERLLLTERGRFFEGDTLEAICPGRAPITLIVEDLRDDDGVKIETANHAMMACSIRFHGILPPRSFLRRSLPHESQTNI